MNELTFFPRELVMMIISYLNDCEEIKMLQSEMNQKEEEIDDLKEELGQLELVNNCLEQYVVILNSVIEALIVREGDLVNEVKDIKRKNRSLKNRLWRALDEIENLQSNMKSK